MQRLIKSLWIVVVALTSLFAEAARAELRLPSVISSGMVLQRDRENPVWGWANPGERVTISVAGHVLEANASPQGRWQVVIPPLAVRDDPLDLRIRSSSGEETALRDVLVGDVWLCTGPSNIFWPVAKCDDAEREIAAARYPSIRFFTVAKNATDSPQADCDGRWFACSPKTVGEVSGVGYFFSRAIHRDQNVPIGVLQSFWGGSRIEAWTSRDALDSAPAIRPILDWWEMPPEPPPAAHHRPASLYNGMIAPLVPFGIRGVICYQGLGNLYWAEYSRELLPVLIDDWRSRWGQADLPVGMVQPAPYPCDRWAKQQDDAYSVQREAQLLVMNSDHYVGVAPTTDLGDLDELHFTNKQDVGKRVSNWALATVYGRDVAYAGPSYHSMSREGDKIRIHFAHAGDGLSTSDGQPPSHFAVAGEDGHFVDADAVIDGVSVVVSNPHVPRPAVVRFAWSDTAIPNLVNSDGLPASLFRTDVPPRPSSE